MALATKYPPHQINYRANIAALLDLGVTEIVAVNAVGAIHGDLLPGSIAVPDHRLQLFTRRLVLRRQVKEGASH